MIQKKASIVCSLCILILFWAFGNICLCEGVVKAEYLVVSMYIGDFSDLHDCSQQVIILFDLQTNEIVDTVKIPDGSVVFSNKKELYVVGYHGYGVYEGLYPYNTLDDSINSVTQYRVIGGKLRITARKKIKLHDNSFIVGITGYDHYILQYANDFSMRILKMNYSAKGLIETGDYCEFRRMSTTCTEF